MAIYDYECNNSDCDFKNEYVKTFSFKDPLPEVCPKCNKGKLEKQFPNCKNVGVDVIGGYDYVYGKKNWAKNKSTSEIAGYLTPDDDGKYSEPY